jgi:hypothetical protein
MIYDLNGLKFILRVLRKLALQIHELKSVDAECKGLLKVLISDIDAEIINQEITKEKQNDKNNNDL